jgi:hypothetical protein
MIEKRRPAKNPDEANLLFIGPRGRSYVSDVGGYRVAAEFAKWRNAVGIKDRVFYDFRRTFQTVAENLSRDKDTVKAIMGHTFSESDMAARYRQGFYDDRLQDVVNHVRSWLFSKKADGTTGDRKRGRGASRPEVQRRHSAEPAKRRARAEVPAQPYPLRIVG